VFEYYEVLPLVALSHCIDVVALESWRQNLHNLEVGYVEFITSREKLIPGAPERLIPANLGSPATYTLAVMSYPR
jgi:hypothetical protein